jgi:protein ImuB
MFAAVYLPQFSLQAVLRHEPELWTKPIALLDSLDAAPLIFDVTEAAAQAGIRPGATPTQAMARCGTVNIRRRSFSQEEAVSAALLQSAYAFSPYLEATAPGLCTLDLRGLAALKEAPEAWQAKLKSWAEKLEDVLSITMLRANIGIGPTPTVAQQAARWSPGITVVEEGASFIAELPLAALEPSADATAILTRWGIRNVGELLALGQDALSQRLGLEALGLFAAASTISVRPLHLVEPPESFSETFDFEPEVETLQPLLFLLRRFVDQFSLRLELRGLVAQTLVLQLALESGEKVVSSLRIPQPTRQADILFRTLQTHLETVRTESAIKTVTLVVEPSPAEQKQLGLFETVLPDPRQFQETLARLTAVLGPERVGTPAVEDSYRPDAFRLLPPDFENAPVPPEIAERPHTALLPIRRFRPAIKAEVEVQGGNASLRAGPTDVPSESASVLGASRISKETSPSPRPISIRCALARGKLKIVLGPWRASGNWWDPGGWEEEEWDATTGDGQVIRLVRRAEDWFVEGIMD